MQSHHIVESISVIIFFTSLLFLFVRYYLNNNVPMALAAAIVLSIGLKCYCGADQYLHEWDERYHALVAKNMMKHPLKPTLYENPIREYDYTDWTNNHIWLSKPPIGLWAISASLSVFGIHEYAVRIPALLFSTLSIVLVFLIGKKLYNERTGLIAAMLYGLHGMLTDLGSGRVSSDSIETCFLFMINLGVYYIVRKSHKPFTPLNYATLGLITGFAFLTKWQPAYLLILLLPTLQFRLNTAGKLTVGILISLLTSFVPILLWYWNCVSNFPHETHHMVRAMFHPLHVKIPGNDATWYTYPTVFGNYFGYTTYLILFWTIHQFIRTKKSTNLFLISWIAIPFIIFSFAEIKRGTYLMIFAPAIFILLGHALSNRHKVFGVPSKILAAISLVFVLAYSTEKLRLFNSKDKLQKDWVERIRRTTPTPGTIIYNEPHYIEMMFYHDVTAYPDSVHPAADLVSNR